MLALALGAGIVLARWIRARSCASAAVAERTSASRALHGEEALAQDAQDAWDVARRAGREPRAYFDALAKAERAVADRPSDATRLAALALAQYRVEHFGDALSTAVRCRAVRDEAGLSPDPRDVAIEAMALEKLERTSEARARLAQARAIAAAPVWSTDDDVRALLSEASSLVDR